MQGFLLRAKADRDQIRQNTPVPAREKLTIEAFRGLGRALAIDPRNSTVRSEQRRMLSELDRIVAIHLLAAEGGIEKGQFGEAGKELALLEDLNRRLGHGYDRELEALGYDLNYRWARAQRGGGLLRRRP